MEKTRHYIELIVNVEDLRNDIGYVVTNNDIVDYIKKKYGFGVHSLYIAQVRGKLGIKLHENHRKVETTKRKVSTCPAYKEEAIIDALQYYGVI